MQIYFLDLEHTMVPTLVSMLGIIRINGLSLMKVYMKDTMQDYMRERTTSKVYTLANM